MVRLNTFLILVAVKLCDSHGHVGHFSHESIISTGLSGLFGSVNKVHEVASAVVGKLPGLNVNFESNVQYGGGGNFRPPGPQYPNYNKPQKKPEELVIVIVEEGSDGNKGQKPAQHHQTEAQQYPHMPPPHQGLNPPPQWQGGYNPGNKPNNQGGPGYYPGNNQNNQGGPGYNPGNNQGGPQYYPGNNHNNQGGPQYNPANQGGPQYYPGNNQNNQGGPQYYPSNNQNNQGYKPNQNYAPNNNYQDQVNFPPNKFKPNFHSNYQPNPNHNQQEDCGQNQEPNSGRPQPGYGAGGGYNQYPNYDNNKPSSTTPQAEPPLELTPAPVTTPKWHDNQNAQTLPTASPAKPTDTSQHTGQGPDNQGYQKPVDHDKEKNEVDSINKPNKHTSDDDEPLLVPLNPNEYVYGGDNIMISAPKRETPKETSTKAPVKEEDEVFPIDIRFGE